MGITKITEVIDCIMVYYTLPGFRESRCQFSLVGCLSLGSGVGGGGRKLLGHLVCCLPGYKISSPKFIERARWSSFPFKNGVSPPSQHNLFLSFFKVMELTAGYITNLTEKTNTLTRSLKCFPES